MLCCKIGLAWDPRRLSPGDLMAGDWTRRGFGYFLICILYKNKNVTLVAGAKREGVEENGKGKKGGSFS